MSAIRAGAVELQAMTPRFDLLSFAEVKRRRCALLDDAGVRRLALGDRDDADQLAWALTRHGGLEVLDVEPEQFDAWLSGVEGSVSALGAETPEGRLHAADAKAAGESIELSAIERSASPAVRFVNATLYDALGSGASDIHLECDAAGLVVKFRIDGVLASIRRMASIELATQAISRVKVMAQLDIAERRVPQDGRLQIAYRNRSIDVRVSVMPSIHGEDAVLRILDRQHLAQSLAGLTLEKLGFDATHQEALRTLCRRPHGMVLVTGPTGSGKTTTLYAAIAETRDVREKIVTIEDPVEYQLPGVLQIPVNERKGLTFARGLRSILRHDPDKILVGEIRDPETAQIAVQSALTGHLVFTTVHANSAFDVVARFEQFGIDASTFSSAINGIVAQRLLRTTCATCGSTGRFDGGDSCRACRGTGYAGRFALAEVLPMTTELKALVASRSARQELRAAAAQVGWRSLEEQAAEAIACGRTSVSEVERVVA